MGESVEINVQGRSSPEHLLEFTLTNASSEPLTIYEHVLPWVGWTSLMLLAVSTDADGTALEKVPPIDDPGATKITINPGKTLTGTISLVSRFPGLPDALRERDIVIFWSYQLQLINAFPLPRTGGWALFPKSS